MAICTRPTRHELEQARQQVLDNSIGVTAGAAAKGISSYTLMKALNERELPAFKLGRDWRIWLSDLDEWAARR